MTLGLCRVKIHLPSMPASLAVSAALAIRFWGNPAKSSSLSTINWKALVSFCIFWPKVSCNMEISLFNSRNFF